LVTPLSCFIFLSLLFSLLSSEDGDGDDFNQLLYTIVLPAAIPTTLAVVSKIPFSFCLVAKLIIVIIIIPSKILLFKKGIKTVVVN
jgi:hypothetical protein